MMRCSDWISANSKAWRHAVVDFAIGTIVCMTAAVSLNAGEAIANPIGDVQSIGLAPLYEALFAVSNCPNVGLDTRAFDRAAALYHLSPEELTSGGMFAVEIAELDSQYRVRLDDDRAAFCSVNRLVLAIPYGILVDRGPVLPHPLPFFGPASDVR